jgi:hypothetical protein
VFIPAGATVIATGGVYDARMLASRLVASALALSGNMSVGGALTVSGRQITEKVILVADATKVWETVVGAGPITLSYYVGLRSTITIRVTAAAWPVYGAATRTLTLKKNGNVVATTSQNSYHGGYGWLYDPLSWEPFTAGAVVAGDVFTYEWSNDPLAVDSAITSNICCIPYPIVPIID